jgi:hypothetical protein
MNTWVSHRKPGLQVTTRCRDVYGFHCSPVADMFIAPVIARVVAAMIGCPSVSTLRK